MSVDDAHKLRVLNLNVYETKCACTEIKRISCENQWSWKEILRFIFIILFILIMWYNELLKYN